MSERTFRPTIKINDAFERANLMQETPVAHTVVGIDNSLKTRKAFDTIRNRNEFFKNTVPESMKLVNSFLNTIGINLGDSIFSGGVDPASGEFYEKRDTSYLSKPEVIKLSPEKYANLNMPKNWKGSFATYFHKIGKSENEGTQYLNYKMGSKIELRQDATHKNEVVIHELLHQIFRGSGFCFSYLVNNKENQLQLKEKEISLLTSIFDEGMVELCKDMICIFFNKPTWDKSYANEVNFIFHLVQNIASQIYGGDKNGSSKALKEMIEWGTTGGYDKNFVRNCKKISTSDFPNGFDIYNYNESQINILKLFMLKNNKSPDLKDFVKKLKSELG